MKIAIEYISRYTLAGRRALRHTNRFSMTIHGTEHTMKIASYLIRIKMSIQPYKWFNFMENWENHSKWTWRWPYYRYFWGLNRVKLEEKQWLDQRFQSNLMSLKSNPCTHVREEGLPREEIDTVNVSKYNLICVQRALYNPKKENKENIIRAYCT